MPVLAVSIIVEPSFVMLRGTSWFPNWLVLLVFLQDLSKKDSALLKLGRELKELETVQEQLETKEQELRAERNTVSKLSYMSNLVVIRALL